MALFHVRSRLRDQDSFICLAVGVPPASRTFHSDHAVLLKRALHTFMLTGVSLRLLCVDIRGVAGTVYLQDGLTSAERPQPN